MTDLLPCPFCTGTAQVCGEADYGGVYVACLTCSCALGEIWDRDAMPEHAFKSGAEAIAAWNSRTVPDTHVLLPKEPSQAMCDAFNRGREYLTWGDCYRAMIEAASQGSGDK